MHSYRPFALALVLALVPACKKSEPEAAPEPKLEPAVSAAPAAPEPAPPPLPPAVAANEPKTQVTDGIPTEEDYEEEAGEVVTADNLETELDKLEAELKPN